MLTRRFMEGHQGICQTGLAGDNGCFTAGDADAHGRLASGDCHGDDELLLFDQVLNESDLTPDTGLFKSRLKRIDERSSDPARGG